MLVLTRKIGEKLLIGEDIVVTVLDVRGDNIRLGIDAPRGVTIQRSEVIEAVSNANLAAAQAAPGAEEELKNLLGRVAAVDAPRPGAPGAGTAETGK
ncbi:carbon storage regulator CsrA [Paenarthrobacter sp. DKR-5]|uniref:carbon storage regulator CsrA n=1 Tax=Paenarthrobacter sp. DKR-5 TaxID=2835535 RepID=UPI001BDD9CFD|nr:carbon storage regulator CsrA [Paenarthrobacter sp. DKR-5]MBT1003778.1 carbon storage regulator CsrA [Paenarthrobacter sp. DKR-5]